MRIATLFFCVFCMGCFDPAEHVDVDLTETDGGTFLPARFRDCTQDGVRRGMQVCGRHAYRETDDGQFVAYPEGYEGEMVPETTEIFLWECTGGDRPTRVANCASCDHELEADNAAELRDELRVQPRCEDPVPHYSDDASPDDCEDPEPPQPDVACEGSQRCTTQTTTVFRCEEGEWVGHCICLADLR